MIRTRVAQWVRYLDYLTTHTSLSPIRCGFAPGFVNYEKGCTRLAAASDKAYQLLAHSRWFSLGNLASTTAKTGRHDIAEILLKVALNTINQLKSDIRLMCKAHLHLIINWMITVCCYKQIIYKTIGVLIEPNFSYSKSINVMTCHGMSAILESNWRYQTELEEVAS